MGRTGWRALLLVMVGAALPRPELCAQGADGRGPGMPDAWRAAVYSFRLEDTRGTAMELLQLLPRTAPEEGRYLRVRTDRARDLHERTEGRYRIEGGVLMLYPEGSVGGTVERARYYGTLICLDGPAGGAARAFRFVRPPDRHTPPPPWPERQGRPPSRC